MAATGSSETSITFHYTQVYPEDATNKPHQLGNILLETTHVHTIVCISVSHYFMVFPLQIPFYPVVKKDLTFIHLGNDSKIEGLINFEKLRMIAKEVRTLTNMCSSPYDLLTMLGLGKILCTFLSALITLL